MPQQNSPHLRYMYNKQKLNKIVSFREICNFSKRDKLATLQVESVITND